MSTPNDYSTDEWQAITAAPVAAGLAVAMSHWNGPTVDGNDTRTIERAIARSTMGDAPEIVKVIARGTNIPRSGGECTAIPGDERRYRKELLISIVRTAVRAVEKQSPAEVEPFKAWLASVAAKVFHAANTNTLPRSLAAPLSHRERDAIDRLADVLRARSSRSAGSARS